MTEAEILQLLIYCTTAAKEQGYKLVDGKLTISWDYQKNRWVTPGLYCSVLEAVLLIGQRIPDLTLDRSDDVIISTLAGLVDRPAKWIESFVDAYNGQSNSHTSISGYVMGSNIRKHFPPNKE